MQRPQQLQQRFSCFVQKPKAKGKRIPLTEDIATATLSIDMDRISILTLSIDKNVDMHMEYLAQGYKIDFYGGFIDNNEYFTRSIDNKFTYDTDSSEFFRYLFNGTIHSVKLSFNEDGTKNINLTCKDWSWGAAAKNTGVYIAYPSANNERGFTRETLKLSDLIKGICSDIGLAVADNGIDVAFDHEYTLFAPAVQNGESDWAFLRNLAKDHACYMWTEMVGNEYRFRFVQQSKVFDTANKRIEFIWLDRTDSFGFTEQPQLREITSNSELKKLKDNQIQALSVDLEVNTQLINGNPSNVVTDFDDGSGEKKTVLTFYDETKDEIIYYELDRAKVEDMVRTDPDEADRLTNMGMFGISQDDYDKYYIAVKIPKDKIKAIDRPMFGIELNITCIGNLNIQPFQSYAVYGIGKWATRPNGRLKYSIHGLTHTWSGDGFMTEINMKA